MWKHLTVEDLRLCLAQDEIDRLAELSLDPSVNDVIQAQMDVVADAFRGAFIGKGYKVDPRAHYLPGSYAMFALSLTRYWVWQRFPYSPSIALDDARKAEYEFAQSLLKDPKIGTDPVDYDDPELSGYVEPSATGASIFVPNCRIKTWWYCGPWPMYSDNGRCNCCK